MRSNNYPSWLVPIEIAKKLKKIGFNTNTLFIYNEEEEPKIMFGLNTLEEVDGQSNLEIEQLCFFQEADMETYECILPTWEQVFAWFRGKGLFHSINIANEIPKGKYFRAKIYKNSGKIIKLIDCKTYEEAREKLINKLIKIYENNI